MASAVPPPAHAGISYSAAAETSPKSPVEIVEAMLKLELQAYRDNPDADGRLDFNKRLAILQKYDKQIAVAKAAEAAIATVVCIVENAQPK